MNVNEETQGIPLLGMHKALQVIAMSAGLFCIWRYMAIAIDVHRSDAVTLASTAGSSFFFGSVDRGTFWHSAIIFVLAIMLVIVPLFLTSVIIARGTRQEIARVFHAAVLGCTQWMPIISVPPLVVVYFISPSMVFEDNAAATVWIAGFAVLVCMMLLVLGKLAARNERKGRVGILAYIITTTITVAVFALILESMGAFG